MNLGRALCAILCFAASLSAASPRPSSSLVFNDLDDVPRYPLDPAEKVASVLLFYWQDCPVCNSYAPEINRLCARYTNFAFYVVQVDPDLARPAAKEHAREYALHAPVLLDPQHRLVKLARATVTPEAVVFGKKHRVLYRGRIDDLYAALGKKRAAATQYDLRAALDAIAAQRPVQNKETRVIGCSIPSAASNP